VPNNYGILVVDPGWNDTETVTIEKAAYLRHRDTITKGSRLLIYIDEPISAVVAEAEATGEIAPLGREEDAGTLEPKENVPVWSGAFVNSQNAGTRDGTGPAIIAATEPVEAPQYRLPLRILRSKATTQPIPLPTLKTTLGSAFSTFDETWVEVTEEQYQAIVGEWANAR
jgi:hypothetical protein